MGLTRAIVRGLRAEYPFGRPGPQAPQSYYSRSGSIPLSGNLTASYATIYQTQPWVAICVNKIARAIMRQPLKVYQAQEDGERTVLRTGSAAELIRRPNAFHNSANYKESIAGNLGIYGNAIVVKSRERPGSAPVELWPSCWANWEVVRGKARPVDWYIFHAYNGEKVPFRPEEVIHFRWWGPGPEGDIIGPSPMEPLRQVLLSEDATFRMVVAAMENGLRPGGSFTTEQTFDLTKDSHRLAIERLRDDLESTYGGVDNAFKFLLLHGGLKWEPMSQTFVDAQIVDLHKLSREVVVATYDIPSPVVGIVDEANFASIEMYHQIFYQDTLGPWNELIEQAHQTQWLNEPIYDGQFLEFDQNDVLKGDIKTRMDAYRLADFMTDNEKRQRENLPPIDDPRADMIWKQINLAPLGGDEGEEDLLTMPQLAGVNGNGRG